MYEVFALLAGALVALAVRPINGTRPRFVALVVLSVAIGAVAALVSGELSVSWAYLMFDAAQVLLAAVATTVALAWWQRGEVQER